MSTDAPAAAPEIRFDVAFDDLTRPQRNRDFQGKGSLVVLEAGPAFVFSGAKREALSAGGAGLGGSAPSQPVLSFSPGQIWNVSVRGWQVQFSTNDGECGRRKEPFVFFCASAADAAAIAGVMPTTKDADFVAGQEFGHRLRQLHGPAHPWASVTNLIIALNVAVFIAMGLAGAGWIDVADMMPYIRYGANRADVTTDGEWWRLVACAFLHYGVMHLALNMWALFQAGLVTERLFGRACYALAYLGGGIAGSLASLFWHREHLIWSAGASGAVFGVYGALLGYMLREKHALPKAVFQPLLKSTLIFAGYNLLFGLVVPRIDNAGHIGGFAGGVLFGWLLALPVDAVARRRLLPARLGLGVATVALVVAGGVMFAPHYDYRLVEELAWAKVNKEPSEKWAQMTEQQEAALKAFANNKNPAEVTTWITREAIPFYARWRDDIAALPLAPGRRTAQRRETLTKILRMKVEACEHLATALRQGDADAVKNFREEERQVAEQVKKLNTGAK